jgi:hypothetical protein
MTDTHSQPPSDRSSELFTAKSLLRESKIRFARGQRGFAFLLLEWAGNARRRAMRAPHQFDLFAGIAE